MPIRVAVFVKQVPETEAIVEVAGDRERLRIEKRNTLNFFDSLAMEEAIRLKERMGGAATAVSLGGEDAVEGLRTCIAMGADRAVLLSDPAFQGSDSLGVARGLAACAMAEPADLYLCGIRATDDEAGAVGSMIAEFLSIPHATGIVHIEVEGDLSSAVVLREAEGALEEMRMPLPALFCVQKGLNEPRIPPIMGVMKAMKAPIERRGCAELALDPSKVGAAGAQWKILRYFPPRKRPAVRMLEGKAEDVAGKLVEILREEYRVI